MSTRKEVVMTHRQRFGVTNAGIGLAHIQRRVEWFVSNWPYDDRESIWANLQRQYPRVFTSECGVLVNNPPLTGEFINQLPDVNLTLSRVGFPCISKDSTKIGHPPLMGQYGTLQDDNLSAIHAAIGGLIRRPKRTPMSRLSHLGVGDEWLLEQIRDQASPDMHKDFFNQWTTGGDQVFTPDMVAQLEHDAPKPQRPVVTLGKPPYRLPETLTQATLRRNKGAPLLGMSMVNYREVRLAIDRGITKARDLTDGTEIDHYTLMSTILLELFVKPE